MAASLRNVFSLILAAAVTTSMSAPAEAQPPQSSVSLGQQAASPFAGYHRVAPQVFVTDMSLFTRYMGPDVTKWQPPAGGGEVESRKRLGEFALTPRLKVYIDVVQTGLPTYYELRDVKNGHLIHRFEYGEGRDEGAVLLLNGRGIVYESARPAGYCLGMVTRKFRLHRGKLDEVKQPYTYFATSGTTTLENLTLYQAASTSAAHVATLTRGTPVTMLQRRTIKGSYWYLIKTPRGLTGWVPATLPGSEKPALKGLFCG